jgi:hypothetical protein
MLCQNCNEIGALLSEIGGPERTGRYIFIYIDCARVSAQHFIHNLSL